MKSYLSFLFFLLTATLMAQQSLKFSEPIYFLDSVEVSPDNFRKVDPKQIAAISVYKDSTATALFGERAKEGVIYVETKVLAKKKLWKLLSEKSAEYKKIFPNFESDNEAVYILNGKVYTENFEGELASLKKEQINSVKIIDKKSLKKDYAISDKKYGILVDFTKSY